MEFNMYYYYLNNDSKKEPIDKVIAVDKESALYYFAERKQLDKFVFKSLYNIEEINEEIQPK